VGHLLGTPTSSRSSPTGAISKSAATACIPEFVLARRDRRRPAGGIVYGSAQDLLAKTLGLLPVVRALIGRAQLQSACTATWKRSLALAEPVRAVHPQRPAILSAA